MAKDDSDVALPAVLADEWETLTKLGDGGQAECGVGGAGEQQGFIMPKGELHEGVAHPVAFHISVTWRSC